MSEASETCVSLVFVEAQPGHNELLAVEALLCRRANGIP